MSKGSKPAGTTTQTTTNPTQAAQLPYLQQGWGSAQSLYNQQPVMPYYPGTTMAPWNPAVQQGYQDIYNTGAGSVAQGLQPNATGAYNTAITGGYGVNNSPAYGAYQSFASGQNPNQQNLYNLQNTALNAGNYYSNAIGGYANPLMGYANAAGGGNLGLTALGNVAQGQGAGMQQLGQTASGYYLNSNPYLSAMVQAAADPVTRNYQTATAPQADYNFANAGRYGSGAMAGLRSTNEQNLGKTLADQSAGLYGQNYSNERARQDAAAQQYAGLQAQAGGAYGNLYNQGLGLGMQGVLNAANVTNQAGNQYSQGLNTAQNAIQQLMASQQYGATGLQGGYQSGNSAAIQALSQYPQFAQAQFIPARSALEAGQGLTQMTQAEIADQMKRYYGEQNAPWDTLAKYMSSIGQYTSGSHSDTTPYYQNQTANLLSGLGGTLGIGQQLFGGSGSSGGLLGSGGLGSLFGAGGGLGAGASVAPLALDAAGAVVPAEAAALLGSSAIDFGGGAALASMAPAAMGFWIICTELMRQKKMPKRYWLAGLKAFAGYPEAVKRGYYVWAIPSVSHLRRQPDSLYSRFLGKVFGWRAEDLAARAGVAGARKLWRGRGVTAALWLPCLALGALVPEQDWRSVYREQTA